MERRKTREDDKKVKRRQRGERKREMEVVREGQKIGRGERRE